MRTPQYKASVFQVVTSDYLVEIAALFVIVLPIFYFFVLIDPRGAHGQQIDKETFFLKFALVVIVSGTARALWKLRRVTLIFDQGIETVGTVTDLAGYKFTSLTFSYTYHDKEYEAVNLVGLTSRTKPLKIGSQVVVVVQTTNPNQALLRNLYIFEDDFCKDLPEFEQLSAIVPVDLMRLPLAERRRQLALQAEQMVDDYKQDAAEREQWQGGDIVEY